ncbi:MAG: endonuclease/exonuclease/phosphatase family protein [Bacteroidales bacterium]|nr:endonuclease/exonuclease/phosphatase family protein [Bacteroidales bacterium]
MLRRLLHNILTVINIALALGLGACYLSTHISPARMWLPALMALAYPIFLALNMGFAIYWALRWKPEVLISTAAILLGFNHMTNTMRIGLQHPSGAPAHISLMSYNCNMFGLYQWNNKQPVPRQIMALATEGKHNVVCFQEFYTRRGHLTDHEARTMLGGMNAHIHHHQGGSEGVGLATFSQFPIVRQGELLFEGTYNACIYTDLAVGQDTVRVYNVHLQSIRLQEHHLQFLHGSTTGASSDENMAEARDIVGRLRRAFIKRAAQADTIAAHARRCPYPVIICGDFNDPPTSYSYRQLAKGRRDAFAEAGRGVVSTYRKLRLALRIDHILHDAQRLRTIRYGCPRVELSDHYPVTADMLLN